jgi:hypothetical protein
VCVSFHPTLLYCSLLLSSMVPQHPQSHSLYSINITCTLLHRYLLCAGQHLHSTKTPTDRSTDSSHKIVRCDWAWACCDRLIPPNSHIRLLRHLSIYERYRRERERSVGSSSLFCLISFSLFCYALLCCTVWLPSCFIFFYVYGSLSAAGWVEGTNSRQRI